MLDARTYDSGLGKTICTYRRAGGGGHKVKELNGNVQCPGVYF